MPYQNSTVPLIVGVDVGGTFTDTIVANVKNGQVFLNKVSSTPSDPSVAFMHGLKKTNQPFEKTERIVHGTTHGTNTLITRKGVATGLITTKGFRDVLEIRRGCRAVGHPFDLQWTKRPSLIPRYLRIDVRERLDSEGNVLCELQEEEVIKAVRFLIGHGVSSIAVCFLFSYLNPVHERRAEQIIKQNFSHIYVSTSSNVLPEWREYERFCATAVNAYILPIMSEYMERLHNKLENSGYSHSLFIMNSTGGMIFVDEAKKIPIQTFLSGPVAGVVAAKSIGEKAGFDNLISADMGGTSFDVGIIKEREFTYTTETEVEEGMPIKLSMVDIRTLGAGGGTIAWIDSGGILKVGPESAGADPGPVCYGRGGKDPTVTDANLVLGRLNPYYFLGGEQKLLKKKAEEVIQEKIATPFGLSWVKAAQGIIKVVTANMTMAIRSVTTEKGIDPREFVLIAFGGAGPLHAVLIARELEISHVVVPLYPGLTSALGLLLSDLKFSSVRSLFCQIERDGIQLINKFLSEMLEQGINLLKRGGYKEEPVSLPLVDVRYAGQHYEISVPVNKDNLSIEDITKHFDNMHKFLYGFSLAGMPHEALRVRMSVIGQISGKDEILNSLSEMNNGKKEKISSPIPEIRKVYEGHSDQPIDYTIYKRDTLSRGAKIEGPAIIEEMDSTIYIPSWSRATVDSFGNIVISLEG